MSKAIKFDFGEFTPAIFAIPPIRTVENSRIAGIASHITENSILECMFDDSKSDIESVLVDDDRHYCRECQHRNNQGRCKASPTRYTPLDSHPRRCKDYMAY
jgi:hypothetical protein